MLTLADQIGEVHHFASVPRSVVSLVPSQTETLCALGLEDSLAGVTKFCVHPHGIKKRKTIVGGTKKVSLEKIATLKPDLIIGNKEENTPEIVGALRRIAPVWVSDVKSIDDSNEFISSMGSIFGCTQRAGKLIADIGLARRNFQSELSTRAGRSVLYLIWKNPLMAAGRETFIDSMLGLNNFNNCISGVRYPEIDAGAVGKPDLVLLSTEPYPFSSKDVLEIMAVFPGSEIRLVDGEMFSWFGSRTLAAFGYFKSLHQ